MANRDPVRLLIGTQAPSFAGGVLTLLQAFLAWARQVPRVAPALAYHPPRRFDEVNAGVDAWLRGRFRPRLRTEEYDGLPAHCVGRLLPAVEACAAPGALPLWRDVLARYDVHQVICGYAVTGLPQALAGCRYALWAATSMDGDRRARAARGDIWRRLAYRLQYRELLRQERTALERAAWVFALSPVTQTELLARGADPRRISLLPCPVDVDRFRPPAETPARPTVLWVGRHDDPRKNTALLIRAFARLADAVPDARLVLVGEQTTEALPRLAADLGVAGRVEFRGRLADAELPTCYREATVFAIPSDQEGLCIAGLEAMACGLPVVSTRCGGPEAFVLPERTGLLVDRDAEGPLADALLFLLTDAAARARLGGQARRLVEAEYSFPTFFQRLAETYARVWPEYFPTAPPCASSTSSPA